MVNKTVGALVQIRLVPPNCTCSRCILYIYKIAGKNKSSFIEKCPDEAVKIINFVKCRPSVIYIFHTLCDDMKIHEVCLLHTEL